VFRERAAKKRAVGLFNALGAKEFVIHPLNLLMIKVLDQVQRNIQTFPQSQQ
jgi:hypothetical protein